ncbi:response regulator [Sulfurimonas sp.]|uniref:response regulator transcription factor n=1 Tax=Sulfurimonas sp. TaxID=2022749 RepID=UPI0025CD35AB|nr:response regulator [Sulfurimonas sp.]
MSFQTLKKISKNLNILYVEDDSALRKSTMRTLIKLFKVVDLAVDGKEGLALYNDFFLENNSYYDIVISDIHMPYLDGIAMSKEIFKINKKQKIIIISAYSDKKYLIDLINIGVESFMQKPLVLEEIFETLDRVCTDFRNENLVELGEGYTFDGLLRALFLDSQRINLSDKESKTIELLIKNKNTTFSSQDIFNYINYDQIDKEFSSDSIKSLFKRLRKKLPATLITNNPQMGYSINL